jgi:hypothetical protein
MFKSSPLFDAWQSEVLPQVVVKCTVLGGQKEFIVDLQDGIY